jgi:hypothetical protein
MRYYLHLRDGQDIAIDEEGIEFATPESLHEAMVKTARDIMAGDVVKGRLDLNLRIDAEAEPGQVLRSVSFSDVLMITRDKVEA